MSRTRPRQAAPPRETDITSGKSLHSRPPKTRWPIGWAAAAAGVVAMAAGVAFSALGSRGNRGASSVATNTHAGATPANPAKPAAYSPHAAETAMMGGAPEPALGAGISAAKTAAAPPPATPAPGPSASPAPAIGTNRVAGAADDLITLDPIRETIDPPNPRFAPGNPAPGTRKMAALLESIYDTAHPESMAFLSDKLAGMFERRATNAMELGERFRLLFNLAVQQINASRPDAALNTFAAMEKMVAENGGQLNELPRFVDVSDGLGIDANDLAGGTIVDDFDNDGLLDLWLMRGGWLGKAGRVPSSLLRNNGDGTFTDVTRQDHLDRICHTMGHNYGDLDNDGWLDFYCRTGDPDFRTLIPKRMFRNAEGRLFQDVTTVTGTGHVQKGHAIAFADLDDDGFQDVYATYGGAYAGDFARNALYHNPGNTNHWLKLKLVGARANRAAIGARLKLTLKGPGGTREIHRVVSSGGSFGCNPLRQEIGLGNATAVSSVEIVWPGSDTRQSLANLQPDRA